MKYLIWSNEHNSWWREDSSGYTMSIANAGRYSLEEAIKICNGANYDWDTDYLEKLPMELPIAEDAALLLIHKIHGQQQSTADNSKPGA